jgi:NAD(P)-dependent dehydrogenase (short-subunit alcohol dehydrogenase family)
MKDLAGRTAFITGGANGIGLGLARALLAQGCKVAIADIRQDSLDAAKASLDNQQLMPVKLDVSSREGFAQAADTVEAELGPVSLLFNNAGVNLFQTIDESSYDDWDWVLGVNLHGVVNGIMTFVPRMKARGGSAHIVNTASMASFLASPTPGIYNTAKFAVRAMSESLRYSLQPYGIGVSVLCPGLVNSAIHDSDSLRPAALSQRGRPADPAFSARLAEVHQFGMDPMEVAEKVLAAIRDDRFYIFPHPEHKQELREIFDEILAAYPEGDAPAQRAAFEANRRDSFRGMRVAAGIAGGENP